MNMATKKYPKRYSDKQLDFLRSGYAKMPVRDLTPAFNRKFGQKRTAGQILAAIKNHRFTCGRKPGERLMPWMSRTYTPEQSKFLKDNYAGRSRRELVLLFQKKFKKVITLNQVKSFVKNHHLQNGHTGFFKKGQQPWNAGTKGLMKRNSGTFNKGNVPKNTRQMGAERICHKDGFILIKVAIPNPYTKAKTRFMHKHVYLWEQKNGPVPEGKVVMFKDGKKLNCILENLILLSRAELLQLNKKQYVKMPAELKPSVLALARLEAKTFARMKQARRAA